MNRNVWLLSLCQALLMTGNILLVSVVGLVGKSLAPSSGMITLPVAVQFLGMMCATVPASLIMGKVGRKVGFSIGNVAGILGSVVASFALFNQSFYWFNLGTYLIGIGIGFGTLYRFAAIELSDVKFRDRAISISMAGGVLAAVLGPNLAVYSKGFIEGGLYIGAFCALVLLNIAALILLQTIKFPKPKPSSDQTPPDSMHKILRAPNFLIAVTGAMVAYAVMNILMTATPLAMLGCGFNFKQAAGVIEWHVLGMFIPSFFTGRLIEYLGSKLVMLLGGILFIGCIAVNHHGQSIVHFQMALVLLGIGWNFMFIGATSLFSQSYSQANKTKAQAFNELFVFTCVAITALVSGWLESTIGWENMNILVLPVVLLVMIFLLRSIINTRRTHALV
ncbi:MFS transporter [Vibrio caribbeanicus]|uniref:Major facilitator superfamily (MFS) profile domain-containing protein n=1 Tax=Vibrio caribbeanicus ATCC BAA-2122 TaxID=796620 RepID=E3BK87_9VIBR|nr:MFS transporter [Vibrio caribbeanicus]EFP96472.1 hypothetical protein VIBC2010_04819 [Vibrio caribbeanicus ATCC BAA-2122]